MNRRRKGSGHTIKGAGGGSGGGGGGGRKTKTGEKKKTKKKKKKDGNRHPNQKPSHTAHVLLHAHAVH